MSEMEETTEFMSAQNLLYYLSPGDLIEYRRQGYYYCHWTMYSDRQGYVYNIKAQSATIIAAVEAKITLEKLVDVAGYDLVRKNNMKCIAKGRGLRAKPPKASVRAAHSRLNKTVDYQVLGENCEYYCTLWKYGVGFSVQAEEGQNILGVVATVGGGVAGAPVGAIGALAVTKAFLPSLDSEITIIDENNSNCEGEREWKSRTFRENKVYCNCKTWLGLSGPVIFFLCVYNSDNSYEY